MTDLAEFATVGPLVPPPTVLRGPADADHYRVQVGRYGERWYCDPLPACDIASATEDVWSSVSGVKKASGSDWSYVAMKRAAGVEPITLLDLDYDARYEQLKTANKLGLAAAGKRGTNVHLMAEARLYGVPDPIPDGAPGALYRTAVQSFFDDHQPELIAAEFVAIHRTLNGHGYGGTSDALVRIGGETFLLDWKSRGEDSSHGAYPEEAAQIAAYARAEYIIVEGDDGPERQRLPHIDGGLIVSIKPDGYRVYPVDLDKAWGHWSSLHAWWVARRTERDAIGRQWAARKRPADRQSAAVAPPPPAITAADTLTPKAQKDAVPASPDEGGPGDPAAFLALEKRYSELDADARAWIGRLITEAMHGGVSFHAKQDKTVRRFEIIRGLVLLADYSDTSDDDLRALVASAVGSHDWPLFPTITPGHVVGAMTAAEAERFALLCDALTTGVVDMTIDDDGLTTFSLPTHTGDTLL